MPQDPSPAGSQEKNLVAGNTDSVDNHTSETGTSETKNTSRSKRRTRNTPVFTSRFVSQPVIPSSHIAGVTTPPISPIESAPGSEASRDSSINKSLDSVPVVKPKVPLPLPLPLTLTLPTTTTTTTHTSVPIPILVPAPDKSTSKSPLKSPAKFKSPALPTKGPTCASGSVQPHHHPTRRLRSRPISPASCEQLPNPGKRISPRKISQKCPVSPKPNSPKKSIISSPKGGILPKSPVTPVKRKQASRASSSSSSPLVSPSLSLSSPRKRLKTESVKPPQSLGSRAEHKEEEEEKEDNDEAPTKNSFDPTTQPATTTSKHRLIKSGLPLANTPTRPNHSGKTLPGRSGIPYIGISVFDKNLILDLDLFFLNNPRPPFPIQSLPPPLHSGCCGRPVDSSRTPLFDNLGCFALGAHYGQNCHFFHINNIHNWFSLCLAETRLANFYRFFLDAISLQDWMLDRRPWDFVCRHRAECLFDVSLQNASWSHFKRVFPRSFVASPEELARYCASPQTAPLAPARSYYRFEHDGLIISRNVNPSLGVNEDFEQSFLPPSKYPTEMYQVGVLLCF
ncbi:uncharacterized protein SAPINGB_P004208 [Magnusiomyces paraingens]|uniref:Uncharacterized protein n=1 Tax=Magnusiomyces paraingens TaxID=2606893 RepID=A0A5E8BUC2_9ASCO|nr:uncharacterized protein SAPINGB_P004208 [Saprochaete ingens]VVT54701.1 unnamed protein product [Saprochaete ingens]